MDAGIPSLGLKVSLSSRNESVLHSCHPGPAFLLSAYSPGYAVISGVLNLDWQFIAAGIRHPEWSSWARHRLFG